jgi:predicted phage-related endonuclease
VSLTAQQKANRLRGVGGSEVLAALGKDPRCSRLELYRRKCGDIPEENLDDNARVLFGQLLEPVIRTEFARRNKVRVIQRHQTLYHHDAPLLGHVDGWVPPWQCGLEIKTADRFEADEFGEEGTDQVPVRYFLQCAAYMAITDADQWHLAVLIGGNTYRAYRIQRDLQIESMLLDGVRAFWRHVETLEPPDPQTPQDVRLRWPKDFGTSITATIEIQDSVSRLRALRDELHDLEARCEAEAMTVQQFMADNAELTDIDGTVLATWRTAKPTRRLDTKAMQNDLMPSVLEPYMREYPGSRRFLLKGQQ